MPENKKKERGKEQGREKNMFPGDIVAAFL